MKVGDRIEIYDNRVATTIPMLSGTIVKVEEVKEVFNVPTHRKITLNTAYTIKVFEGAAEAENVCSVSMGSKRKLGEK